MQCVRSILPGLLIIILLTACGQRPPIETTILPEPNESPTSFVNLAVSAATTETPTAAISDETPTVVPPTEASTTAAVNPGATVTPVSFPIVSAETVTAAAPPPGDSQVATQDTTPDSSQTGSPASAASATPCFGAINGSVVADLNQNGQAEGGEPGIQGSTIFLRNASGVVGLYTTGNGQFYFPGLVAGQYTITATPPSGYSPSGSMSFELVVTCGATLTQNLLVVATTDALETPASQASAPATPTPIAATSTPTPTRASALKLTPVPNTQVTPRPARPPAAASSFKPFDVSAVYDLSGCGSINAPGLYRLTTSLVSQWDCLQLSSDNVILDCQGNSVNGTDFNGYGVVVHHVGNFLSQRPPRNIEIRNCKIGKHKYGVFIDAADNLYIHDNDVSGNFRDVDERNFGVFLGLAEGGGLRVGDTRNALIANNRADNSAIGIDVRMGSGITVHGNTANQNSAWGVHFYGVQFGEISENTAQDNVRYCTWGTGVVGAGCDAGGIMLQSGSNKNVVKNNTIGSGNGNGIFIKAHGTPCGNDNIIAGNSISGAMYNAIELSFCQNNKLQGNHISNSLDGIWLGFAVNNEINAGNELRDLSNHGIISWNSHDNNISTNVIVNSREGMYFYSSDYDREQFFFVPGAPEDHASRGNCLCDNRLELNAAAAIHLNNSFRNQITKNKLTNNGVNFLMEGNTSGNIIQDNEIQGGSYLPFAPRPQYASMSDHPSALVAFNNAGRRLSSQEFIRALQSDSPFDSFALRWFKYKLRVSLGIPHAAPERDPLLLLR